MANQEELDRILEIHPTLNNDGWFYSEKAALRYYENDKAQLSQARDIPFDEFTQAVAWLETREKLKRPGKESSYGWKNIMERETGVYVSNGALIAAALFLEVPVKQQDESPNAMLGIK